ncbi:Membrane protein [Mycena sanguinolenta]|uniref:Membrane protein n=1 Tax=Mycena sanguinolenta TaxID=230812 RepID=A0A8H6XGP0_9AGAR|nr:Membrane protein [Mycena sanguinolenta]
MPAPDKLLMSASVKSGKSLFDWPQSASPAPFPLLIFSGYLSTIPVINFLSSPTGPVSQVLTPLLSSALHCASNGVSSIEQSPQKAVALLTLFYVFVVFILSAIMSVTGQLLGNEEGYKNKEPRMNKRGVSNGLPHRMIATHEALYDIFPVYAIAAALFITMPSTQSTPSASTSLNALILHVFLKLFVYAPCYLLDIDLARSYSHMCAVTAVLLAIWVVVVG